MKKEIYYQALSKEEKKQPYAHLFCGLSELQDEIQRDFEIEDELQVKCGIKNRSGICANDLKECIQWFFWRKLTEKNASMYRAKGYKFLSKRYTKTKVDNEIDNILKDVFAEKETNPTS